MSQQTAKVLRTEDASDVDGHATDVVVDPGGGNNITAELALPPGDDSKPLPGDFAALKSGSAEGSRQAVAFFDPATESKTADGEKRIYGRDAQGNTVCEIWLKNNGEIQVTNFRDQAITISSQGPIILDSDDIRLGSDASQSLARVGDYIVATLSVSAAAAAILAPSPTGSIKLAGQIVSGRRGAKG